MLRVGVIGCGYWGPNLIRNFANLKTSKVMTCADLSEERLKHMKQLYPTLNTTTNFREIIGDQEIDAVVIATPVSSHYPIAREALEAGKHVFIEKPLAQSVDEGRKLLALAREKERVIMVGHTFVFTAAVNKIKDLIWKGEIGEVYFISTSRVNLGIFQDDINVVWDLAPHDISIMNYILNARPTSVSAIGQSYIRPGIEDVAFLLLRYPQSTIANVHVSWLNPNKIRSTTVVGSKKMLVYDDVSSLEKIRIYDKGVTVTPHYDTFGEFQLSYRYGDISIPRLDDAEPLKIECQHFVDCIENGVTPRSGGTHGFDVLLALDAADRSMHEHGKEVTIDYPAPMESTR
ncbi:MAG: Gfo/Idh/MocA family oxidoreductase [Candidatus Krumholzibacteria bacterium]|nr:Gfo/Idh/MocA family oxidoreductase [Candidatus Krumholzibacteria bacterium]